MQRKRNAKGAQRKGSTMQRERKAREEQSQESARQREHKAKGAQGKGSTTLRKRKTNKYTNSWDLFVFYGHESKRLKLETLDRQSN